MRKRRIVLKPKEKEELIKLHEKGKKITDLQLQFGVSRKTIYNILNV